MGADPMTAPSYSTTAKLEAIAAVRAALAEDADTMAEIMGRTDDPGGLALAAVMFTTALFRQMPEALRDRILDALRDAAIAGA